ncbi:Diacetylchitobiose deacetylase [Candidatus Lokiarchaeum ossiferum]|uniref:Diacetylchitobiose deacetylase n=1 Tax=Candidatus Lokiarchaeum ossiferum TaxID=2951803 RepID=A0ABY6HMR4_9ARCH|nr:Diacetylchitobiose deacetylase [Candidatus Lokiarchaeum sp. B-35]
MTELKETRKEEKYDVIVVTAHPDDAEIGIGGIMATLAKKGKKVLLVNLTDGEPTPLGDHDTRIKEASAAAEILGIDRLTLDCCVNRRLMDSFEARVSLGDVFRKHRPEIVITMGGKTIMASPDHYQAQLITEAAVFYSRLTKWDEHFTYPVHTIKQLFYFPVGAMMSGQIPHNSFLVDISSVLQKKLDAILTYESQFPPEKRQFIDQIKLHNQHFGALYGSRAAELLMLPRLLRLDILDIFNI